MIKIVFLLIALPLTINAQILYQKSYVYSGLAFNNYNSDLDTIKSNNIAIAPVFGYFKVDKKKNLDDFQLYNISFREIEYITERLPIGVATQPSKGFINTTYSINAAYHKIISLNKKSTGRLNLGLGVGMLAFHDYLKTVSVRSTEFPKRLSKTGLTGSIKPVVNYLISDRIFLGISTALHVGETTLRIHRISNPALRSKEQRNSRVETTILTNKAFNLQLLLGINI